MFGSKKENMQAEELVNMANDKKKKKELMFANSIMIGGKL